MELKERKMKSASRVLERKIASGKEKIHFEKKITNRGLSLMKLGIGNVLYSEKMYNMALRFYSEAVGLCPDSSNLLTKANCHMQIHEYKEALEEAKKSIEFDPKSIQGHSMVATCALALGDLKTAREYFLMLQELKPSDACDVQEMKKIEDVYSLFLEADREFAKKNYVMVVKLLDLILERMPSRKVKLRRAECFALLGHYDEASEVASNILFLDKSDEDALYVLGLCSYYQGSLDLSLRRLRRVMKVNSLHKKAKELLDKVAEMKSKSEDGLKACEDGCYRKSHRLYSEALSVDPGNKIANMQLYLKRARILFKLCKSNEAIEDCSAALELNPNSLDALLLRAKLYMTVKNYDLAIADYENVCKASDCYEYKLLLKHAKRAMKTNKRCLYSLLGIDSTATPEQIKCAYRKKSLLHHPDRHATASLEIKAEQEILFKEVGRAYNILSDPEKRRAYDNEMKII